MKPVKTLIRSPRLIVVGVYLLVFGLGLSLSLHIYNLGKHVRSTTTLLSREQLPLLKEISNLKNNITRIEPTLYEYYATVNREIYLQRSNETATSIDRSWSIIRPKFEKRTTSEDPQSSPGEFDAKLVDFESSYNNIKKIAGQLDKVLDAPRVDWDEARTLLMALSRESQHIESLLDQFVDIVQSDVFAAGNQADSGLNDIVRIVAAYSLTIFLGAILVGIAINSRRKAERRLVEQARHDPVTGLPNRLMFEEMISKHPGKAFGLMLLGVDQFKRVLGGLGLNAGDQLLQAVAERIHLAMVNSGFTDYTLFRFEGVEFGLVVAGTDSNELLTAKCMQVHTAMEAPFIVEQREMYVAMNCGISFYPRDSNDGRTIVRNAGAAMQASRVQSRHRICLFDQAMNTLALDRLSLENDLRRAIEKDELLLHYQPQVSLATGEVIGVEALLRWQRNGQMVSPAMFIPHAEVSGLIIPIGNWVLRQACTQARIWKDMGLQPMVVAVNISPRQFLQDDFVESVQTVLEQTAMPPELLELEITEGAAVQDVEQAIATLIALKKLGVKLSIDDFGTGYSSLSYLKRFSVDKLKIDQSFVRQMSDSLQDAAIVTVVVELAHQLGLVAIAEGVETVDQLNHLIALGCNEIQGYYFSRPIPAKQLEEKLSAGLCLNLDTESKPQLSA